MAPPHLHIRRPSPTAAEFAVSSHPPATTIPARALYAAFLVARLLLALGLLILLDLNLYPPAGAGASPTPIPHPSLESNHPPPTRHRHPLHPPAALSILLVLLGRARSGLRALALSSPLAAAPLAAAAAPTWALAAAAAAACWIATRRVRTTESLLVLRGLGVQTTSSSGRGSWLVRAETRFIPTAKILDILINEAFIGFEVRYYLAVVVDGEDDLIVVFPNLLPGRHVVEAVWRGVRGCLWEGDLVRRVGAEPEPEPEPGAARAGSGSEHEKSTRS